MRIVWPSLLQLEKHLPLLIFAAMRIRDPYRASKRASILGLFLVIAVFIVGMAWLIISMTSRSFFSSDNQSEEVDGLTDEVQIVRDQHGIPYIVAANENDAYTGLGYAHAQDRLWQMDLFRRFGKGRLSELMGTRLLGFDAYARTIGFERTAREIVEKTPGETMAALKAYCRGVNRFIDESEGHLPFEFDALGYTPEHWDPVDCILMIRMVGWEQNTALWTDLAYDRIRARVDSAKFEEIAPWYPSYGPTIIPGGQKPEPLLEALRAGAPPIPQIDSGAIDSTQTDSTTTSDSTRRPSSPASTATTYLDKISPLIDDDYAIRQVMGIGGSGIGSNGWVIAGDRTIGGKPILANDPHLQHSAPSKWYQAVLLIGTRTVAGATIPGIPFIVAGRNDDIAWGITNLMADETDFYLEKIDQKKDRVLHDNRWEELEVVRDTIHTKDTLDSPIEIRISRHGPLISDLMPVFASYPPPLLDTAISRGLVSTPADSFALALRWTGRDPSHELAALQKVNRATNFRQFNEAVKLGGVPGMSLLYADRKGTIGYVPGFRAPNRPGTYLNRVNPGWESRYNWRGFHSVGDLPTLSNPESGFIGSANNKLSNSLSFSIGDLWCDPSRATRIEQYLKEGNSLGVIDCVQMQGDVLDEQMAYMVEFLIRAFPDSLAQGAKVREAIGRLRNWRGEVDAASPEASIAAEWAQIVYRMTWKDELGESLFRHFMLIQLMPQKAIRHQLMIDSRWFDDVTTTRREVRDDILRNALGEALDSLHKRFDTWDLNEWTFGKMHTVTFRHPFSIVDPLRNVVNIGPFEIGGSAGTLNKGEWDFNNPYDVTLGPSLRQIVDFADTTIFLRSVIATGESGQPMSDTYQDQSVFWLFNGYLSIYNHLPPDTEIKSTVILSPS